jgi:integrase
MQTLNDGTFSILIRFGTKRRQRIRIDTKDAAEALRRIAAVKKLGKEIGLAKLDDPAFGVRLLELAGRGHIADARDGLKALIAAGPKVKKGEAKKAPGAIITMSDLADAWISGRLARQYPDHVRLKKTADADGYCWQILAKQIGQIPVKRFVLEDAEAAMRILPPSLSGTTRRHYMQVISRLLQLAVYPLRLIPATPLPRGFLPKLSAKKAKAWLYPAEDAALMASTKTPIVERLYYGTLAREGFRASELLDVQRRDIDFTRGVFTLDRNKTNDPRAWAGNPSVIAALGRCFGVTGDPDDYFFQNHIRINRAAAVFRQRLKQAGVTRPELFEKTKSRLKIRLHDLRATFITSSLANGKSETWVADRTGHRSSNQINDYRRAARAAEELGLGELAPLDTAIKWGEGEDESVAAE